jgi:hypothetical protein
MLELEHIAGNKLAFAGAAVTGLAGERKRYAGAQQRSEDGVPRLNWDRLSVAFQGDLHARPEGDYDGTRLFGVQTK